MLENIEKFKKEIEEKASQITSPEALEEFRLYYLSRKGLLNDLFENLKTVDKSIKGNYGKYLNELKNFALEIFEIKSKDVLKGKSKGSNIDDFTLPGKTYNTGSKHLLTQALEDITKIFERIGFKVYEGPEIEDEYHNFDALNTPDYHPSRDMQDTFYISSK
jgi:phenylalanyl-tRNA synthetase alpha chain